MVTVIAAVSRTVSTGTWYPLTIGVNGSAIQATVDGVQIGQGSDASIGSVKSIVTGGRRHREDRHLALRAQPD